MANMSLSTGYLTPKQTLIWDLSRTGLKEANIARKLKVERQTIHKALDIATEKVYISLQETAQVNKIKIKTINPTKGYLIGNSAHFKTKALITFSAENASKSGTDMKATAKAANSFKHAKKRSWQKPKTETFQFQMIPAPFYHLNLQKHYLHRLQAKKE